MNAGEQAAEDDKVESSGVGSPPPRFKETVGDPPAETRSASRDSAQGTGRRAAGRRDAVDTARPAREVLKSVFEKWSAEARQRQGAFDPARPSQEGLEPVPEKRSTQTRWRPGAAAIRAALGSVLPRTGSGAPLARDDPFLVPPPMPRRFPILVEDRAALVLAVLCALLLAGSAGLSAKAMIALPLVAVSVAALAWVGNGASALGPRRPDGGVPGPHHAAVCTADNHMVEPGSI